VWVPDRHVPRPDGAVLHVPGHWERRLSPREVRVPTLIACTPTGDCALVPAATRAPADVREGP
jgi:hypothetical protein